jgi:hypothetical protein
MDIGSFYSENPVSSWKVVLGEDMHYHYGTTGDNPFEQAVLDLMEFIPPNSKVLDCGCGWGGPGRVLQKHGHTVVGVTNSKTQADYITDFPVILADLHDFVPEEQFDAAIFIESYFHLKDPRKVFDNLVPFVKHIAIMDVVNPTIVEISEWGIEIGPKEYMMGNLHKVGYVVNHHHGRANFAEPTLKYWRDNIKKLPKEEIYGQIKLLEHTCNFSQKPHPFEDAHQIFIHAKRR